MSTEKGKAGGKKGPFEDHSFYELFGMIADANPSHVTNTAYALQTAGEDLTFLTAILKSHIDRVNWYGEGGEAFRQWGSDLVIQAYKLAEYAWAAGSWLQNAGDRLTEVKAAMPPMEACSVDPAKEKTRMEGLESKQKAAAHLMTLLDDAYRVTHQELGKLDGQAPVFKPLPLSQNWDYAERPYGTGSEPGAPSSSAGTFTGATGLPSEAPGSAPASSGRPGSVIPSTDVPSTTGVSSPATGHVGSHPAPGGPAGTNLDSTAVLPSPDTLPPVHTTPLPDDVRSTGRVPGPTPMVPIATVPHIPIDAPGRTLPVSPVPGTGRQGGGFSFSRPGGQPHGGPREGIIGGTPARTGNESGAPKLPRGTVVGGEAGTGRAPIGVGGGFGGTPAGGGSGGRGAGTGRRLAWEPGGTAGTPRSTRGPRSEFTLGGTGLVQGNGASVKRAKRRKADRPAYLTEEESTWTSGQRPTVPPVIE
ncbi:hypothetical protein GCM10010218_64770 [Streptomyces mashuensis]|uniref:Uncharacterized protein n=1 Tax=Streptomyces mashuensis TaxID=33904 RepID=A0A919B9D1_9ACTN|nr:hypothetical protein [Streptomyces mashuensis]GHF74749.1 hypothetical protein GCM10010218_64770 [Streptomyces mashuensis]